MKCQHKESVWTRDGKECRKCGLGWYFALKEKRLQKQKKLTWKCPYCNKKIPLGNKHYCHG